MEESLWLRHVLSSVCKEESLWLRHVLSSVCKILVGSSLVYNYFI